MVCIYALRPALLSKAGRYSDIYIVKPLSDRKLVPVQIHNFVGAHAHAAAG